MNVAEAVAHLGIDVDSLPGDLVIVQLGAKGARNYLLAEVAHKPVNRDLYIASGAFSPGTITEYKGRASENVERVLWLPIDCDLKDFVPDVTKDDLWTWSDGELMQAAVALETDLRAIFEAIGVPVHRIDYTGYGICAYVYLAPHGRDEVPSVRIAHKALVDRINQEWKGTLADPAVSDAGTRFTRLVPCPNTKSGTARQTKTLYRQDGQAVVADLVRTLNARELTTVGRAIPRTGAALDPAVTHELIDALARNWVDGKRHGLALAAAGMLAKAGVAEDQARTIIEYAAHGDPELDDRLRAVETSYARARAGLDTRGLYGMRDWLPAETVDWIDRTLGEVRVKSSTVTFTVPETTDEPIELRDGIYILPIPEIARQGIVGEYIALMRPTTEAPDGFHLGTFLTVVSALMGRDVWAEFSGVTYANLYTLLVGDSGRSRKDTAIKGGIALLKAQPGTDVLSNVNIATDISSAEGLIGILKDNPNTLIYLTEFARMMANSKRQSTGNIQPVLIEAYDMPEVLSNNTKSNPLRADLPCVTMLAATQPRILDTLVGELEIHSGFLNRWLIIPGQSTAPNPWPPGIDRATLGLMLAELHALIRPKGARPRGLDISAGARTFWEHWYVTQWHQAGNEDEGGMSVRHPMMVVKIALIYAILNGDQVIDQRHLEVGIAVIAWMRDQVARMLPGWGGTMQGRIEAKVIQFLTDHGAVKRKVLTQYCRSRTWSTHDLNMAVDAMCKSGILGIDSAGMVGLRDD